MRRLSTTECTYLPTLNQINNTNSYISALARRILIYRIALCGCG